jgi:hypothetical protein
MSQGKRRDTYYYNDVDNASNLADGQGKHLRN